MKLATFVGDMRPVSVQVGTEWRNTHRPGGAGGEQRTVIGTGWTRVPPFLLLPLEN